MQRKWLKFIAILEIVGGNAGILWLLWQLSSASLNVFVLFLALIVFGIYEKGS